MSAAAEIVLMEDESAGLWILAWRRLRRDRLAMFCLGITALFVALVAASALGWLAEQWNQEVAVSYAPPTWAAAEQDTEAALPMLAAPGTARPVDISDIDPLAPRYEEWRHREKKISDVEAPRDKTLVFGADKWGHSVWLKTVKGAQISIAVGLVAASVSVLIGTLFGALAGYWGGYVDDVLEWFYNIFTSIPYILLILAIAAVFSRGFGTLILILGFTGWTGIYRLVRAEYMKHAERAYVRAAQALGASHVSRMFVHILPNITHVVLVQFSQYVVQFIKAEVILSFLDLGVPVNMVSWGTMLAEAQEELVIGKWWQLAAAGGSMAILVTAISLLTDSMRDALDPKLSE
jgi:peptide/nickel transport system permease protein